MTDNAWLFHSVDRTFPSNYTFNNFTHLPWDSVDHASPGMYFPEAPTRLTCINDGVHIVLAQASWHDSASGDYGIAIRKNGGVFRAETQPASTGHFWPAMQCVVIDHCNAGDYFEVLVGQMTGSNRTLGSDGSWFSIVRIPDATVAGDGFTEAQIRQMIREEITATTLTPSAV